MNDLLYHCLSSSDKIQMFLFSPRQCACRAASWSLVSPSPPSAPWRRVKPDSPVNIRWRLRTSWCRSPGIRTFQTVARIRLSQSTSKTAKQVHQWRRSSQTGVGKSVQAWGNFFLKFVMSEVHVVHVCVFPVCVASRNYRCSCSHPLTWYVVQAFIIKTKTTICWILWFHVRLQMLSSSGCLCY